MSIQSLRRWLMAFAAAASLVAVSIWLLDCPVARFLARFGVYETLPANETVTFPWMVVAAAIGVAVGVWFRIMRRPMPRWAMAGLQAGLALIISVCLIKYALKPLFSRAIPTNFLATGQDGFFGYDKNQSHDSFPSGHSGQAAAMFTVLLAYYPAYRWIYAAGFVLLATVLMLGEWHFLSDIIAGAFIGWTLGLVVMAIWSRLARQGGS